MGLPKKSVFWRPYFFSRYEYVFDASEVTPGQKAIQIQI